jgi:CubicO group peptidase (beta-lactamase class C family)
MVQNLNIIYIIIVNLYSIKTFTTKIIRIMKIKLLPFLFFVFWGYSTSAQTGIYVPELAQFDDAMNNLMSTYNVPGGQLAITYQGRLVYNRGFGFANTTTQDSVYPHSIFRIASVSKTITGIACMKLFEQGKLNLNAKVFGAEGILNDAQYQNILDPRVNDITVRMLLHHSGGWNRDISGDPMFNAYNIATAMGVAAPPSAGKVIEYVLMNKMLDFTPGSQYQYSNFGYNVLGRVIEKITGKSYEDYVRTAILEPLGISKTKLGYNLLTNQLPDEVNYYDYAGAPKTHSVYDNSTMVPWPYGGFNLEFMDAHGGYVSSGEDLMKLLCAIDRFDTRPDILTKATIDTMTKPSTVNANYASGIAVNQYNNWWHMGSLPGTTAEIVRNGNGQINWAILLNTRDQAMNINQAVDNLVWNVLPSINNWPDFDLFSGSSIGIDEKITVAPAIKIYPNPASENLVVSVNSGNLKSFKSFMLKLFNSLGQEIFNQQLTLTTNTLDISQLPDGIYILQAVSDNQVVYQEKLMIKK